MAEHDGQKQIPEEIKQEAVERYRNGEKVAAICEDLKLPRSTFYYILNKADQYPNRQQRANLRRDQTRTVEEITEPIMAQLRKAWVDLDRLEREHALQLQIIETLQAKVNDLEREKREAKAPRSRKAAP